jgi:hypothetical protein
MEVDLSLHSLSQALGRKLLDAAQYLACPLLLGEFRQAQDALSYTMANGDLIRFPKIDRDFA